MRVGRPLLARTAANQEWALDFVHDAVEFGRTILVLSVVDARTRECLALEVDTSFASRRVSRVLDEIVAERGAPQSIRCDNGPELCTRARSKRLVRCFIAQAAVGSLFVVVTSRQFLAWAIERKIELLHIRPVKPTQNARLQSFNGKLREECLNLSWFQNLFDARRKISAWRARGLKRRALAPHLHPRSNRGWS